MAFRKLLSSPLLHLAKSSSPRTALSPPPSFIRRTIPVSTTADPFDPQILHKKSIFQSESPALPIHNSDNLIDWIRSSMMQNRSEIDAFAPPIPTKKKEESKFDMEISLQDLRKLLMATRIEAARAKLKRIPNSSVSYSEFFEICRESAGGSEECAGEIADSLDRSGSVIVLANVVFLRPEQVARAIESVIRPAARSGEADETMKELKEMEVEKDLIDRKAEGEVKRELRVGLGFFVIQTLGFMRLTFWELSWDVMEPICFFTTSVYFMLGYVFFLRTAKEPSFEGFFSNRFAAKQRRLIKAHNFDLLKFMELKMAVRVDSKSGDFSSVRL